MAVVIIFLFSLRVFGQEDTASLDRNSLISEIKLAAARHVKTGTPMQTDSIIRIYQENSVGLTTREISLVYENEYMRLKESRKTSIWEVLRPDISWLISILLILAFIFSELIKKTLAQSLDNFAQSLWRRFAGFKIFRGLAIRRYQEEIIRRYSSIRVPFSEHPLNMEDIYVPLKVAGTSIPEHTDASHAIRNFKKLMIIGPPGSGKTMLLRHIAYLYAKGNLASLPDRSVPVLIEMQKFSAKPELTVEQHLIESLTSYKFQKAEPFVRRGLDQGTLLLLLDGLDEVNSSDRDNAVRRIKSFLSENQCRVLITCRTAVYRSDFSDTVDSTLELEEFNDQQIRRFLRSWEEYMILKDRSINHLIQVLQERPKIMSLARNPLLLTIVAYLYTHTDHVLPHSRAEFYKQSINVLLIRRDTEKNPYKPHIQTLVLQHLALYFVTSANERQQDRRSVDYQEVLRQIQQVLPTLGLTIGDAGPLLTTIVERSGLLLSIENGRRYQFVHLTLQEYFAACELMKDSDKLLTYFEADPDSWRETAKLWCGLDHDSTELIRRVFSTDEITALECIADAKQVDSSLSNQIINKFKTKLTLGDNSEPLTHALGAIAAAEGSRGSEVFEFLVGILREPITADQTVRYSAAMALSSSSLPKAAQILSEYWSDNNIRQFVIKMGELAVPELLGIIKAGELRAFDDLRQIGTPNAAEAMVEFLWDKDKRVSYTAAWRVAALLEKSDVEDSLRNYKLSSEQMKARYEGWIWAPFNEREGSALPIIAGRIAYLLLEGPLNTAPETPDSIDPRISIGLIFGTHHCNGLRALDLTQGFPASLDTKLKENGLESLNGASLLSFLATIAKTPLFPRHSTQEVLKAFLTGRISDQRLLHLFLGLSAQKQLKVIQVVDGASQQGSFKEDWISQYSDSVTEYDIATGWHFRIVGFSAVLVSLIVIVGIVEVIPVLDDWIFRIGVIASALFAIVPLRYFFIDIDESSPQLFLGMLLIGWLSSISALFSIVRGLLRHFIMWLVSFFRVSYRKKELDPPDDSFMIAICGIWFPYVLVMSIWLAFQLNLRLTYLGLWVPTIGLWVLLSKISRKLHFAGRKALRGILDDNVSYSISSIRKSSKSGRLAYRGFYKP